MDSKEGAALDLVKEFSLKLGELYELRAKLNEELSIHGVDLTAEQALILANVTGNRQAAAHLPEFGTNSSYNIRHVLIGQDYLVEVPVEGADRRRLFVRRTLRGNAAASKILAVLQSVHAQESALV